ncbi:CDP-glycerol glycerophosphotransferase family protein [Butyrivibrio sp. VCB2006]|uniref:CDP-glycerol glycerophosphotransferase family protein n=1 Tax=Butyrivibrio sp. VCB2006 TaxID=1280679 RepID=UPI00041D13AD|nr:CDP-glycerol glycerophosphotransferase family protein [Butyrivibrio sp. VCB2006]
MSNDSKSKEMKLASFFNEKTNGKLWHISRTFYYDYRHLLNSFRLPKGKRYFSLEKKIEKKPVDKAIELMNDLFKENEAIISQKKKIRVGFCVYSSAEWQCEKVYRYMEADDRFTPSIILCGLNTDNSLLTNRTYMTTCRYFEEKATYSLDYYGCEKHSDHDNTLDEYDILFYFQPSSNYLPEAINFAYRLQNQLMLFVLYAYKLESGKDVHVKRNLNGVDLLQMFWMHFCTNYPEYLIRKNKKLRAYNAIVTGLPKIDDLLDKTYETRYELFKTTSDTKYKIIWAPHFNMEDNMNGTFYENYTWFYEYARTHSEYSWIVRPHPRMMKGALKKGVFESEEAYDEYMDKWDELPNARVIPFGDYYDFFDSSDAMITDSLSFIYEYSFTQKPLLVLLPEKPRILNEEAEKLVKKGCYSACGSDFESINRFIEEYISDDPIKESRLSAFKEILDIRGKLGMSTSEYIYKWVCDRIYPK